MNIVRRRWDPVNALASVRLGHNWCIVIVRRCAKLGQWLSCWLMPDRVVGGHHERHIILSTLV
jgi:hypothetical protein